MKNKVLSVIDKYNMLEKGDRVIVALSGGADSVCLLYMLISLKEQYELTLAACHLNHNLRGEESDRDADFVRTLCREQNIELFEKSADIGALAKLKKQSAELCGREARYEFFGELAKREKAKIATAHTASDNLETLLFNIARGTSLNGLKGIAPKRDYIIRPLIAVTRSEVEAYCLENNLAYVTDSTNLSDDYTRNKIRHNAVPSLKSVNPNAEESAYNLSRDAEEVNNFLDKTAASAFGNAQTGRENYYDAQKLRNLSPVVQKHGVCLLCKSLGISGLSRRQLELCRGIIETGGRVDLDGGYSAVCSQDIFRIVKNREKSAFEPVELKEGLRFEFDNKEFFVEKKKISQAENSRNLVDYSVLENNSVFRLKQPGDFMKLPRRNVTKSLKKLLIEEKIPREQRESLIVLADGGEVLWLQGYGASKTAEPVKNAENAVEIAFKEINS